MMCTHTMLFQSAFPNKAFDVLFLFCADTVLQLSSPPIFSDQASRQPLRIMFKLFEGVFLYPSLNVIKIRAKPIDYFDHSHEWRHPRILSVLNILAAVVTFISNNSEIDTRVNGCPVLLDFRKRVVYSSYTCLRWPP